MNKTVDKNTPEALQGKVNSARVNILLMVVFTVINLVLLLTESGRYFLFSATVPYELTFEGAVMNYLEYGEIFGAYTYTGLVISAAVLALYVVCALLTKKSDVWYIVAGAVFVIDTALLVYWNSEYFSDIILDLVFHAWVLYSIFSGFIASKKLKQLQAEAVEQKQQLEDAVNAVFTPSDAE